MEFRVLFFHILRSISLVSWYLESPHVARIGQRLANCPYPTLACIEASQNALRNYQKTLALRAECERQNRLDQLYQNELREVQDKKYQAELVKNATLWKTKGEAPPVFIDQRTINNNLLQFNNFCPNDINPALFFKNLERNCDNLHKLN
ncbi:hypothetical protein SLS60_003098 [Paraconiothyrium brasiliense]|uniref:Uncharacterized protein n=1 Tax=Paraconiothyrium brasiliense TaxID=300254 RepID=A0ABR3RVM9_9PLEO